MLEVEIANNLCTLRGYSVKGFMLDVSALFPLSVSPFCWKVRESVGTSAGPALLSLWQSHHSSAIAAPTAVAPATSPPMRNASTLSGLQPETPSVVTDGSDMVVVMVGVAPVGVASMGMVVALQSQVEVSLIAELQIETVGVVSIIVDSTSDVSFGHGMWVEFKISKKTVREETVKQPIGLASDIHSTIIRSSELFKLLSVALKMVP